MGAEIFPCWGPIKRIHKYHPPYLLQVLWPNKQRNQKRTGLYCKNFVACKKHQAIWKFRVGEPPIHPTRQPNWRWIIYFAPNRVRNLWPTWSWTVLALFKMFLQCKAFPVGSGSNGGRSGKAWHVGSSHQYQQVLVWNRITTTITTTTVKWFLDVRTVAVLETEGSRDQSAQTTTTRPKLEAVAACWKDWFRRNLNTWAWYGYSIKHLCTRPLKASFTDQARKRPIHGYAISLLWVSNVVCTFILCQGSSLELTAESIKLMLIR